MVLAPASMTAAWANELEKVAHPSGFALLPHTLLLTWWWWWWWCGGEQWIPDVDPLKVIVVRGAKDVPRLARGRVIIVPYGQMRDKSKVLPVLQSLVRRKLRSCSTLACDSRFSSL